MLVGGSAVSVHTKNRYQSLDVDLSTLADTASLAVVMKDLGFSRTGRVWAHPRFVPTVDFVSGPPSVGETALTGFVSLSTKFGSVEVVTATQAVMDRLAAFYHWNDRQSLDQALLIARDNRINLEEAEAWSRSEGMAATFAIFKQAQAIPLPRRRLKAA